MHRSRRDQTGWWAERTCHPLGPGCSVTGGTCGMCRWKCEGDFHETDAVMQQMAQCMSGAAAAMPQLEQLLISWCNSLFDVSWAEGCRPACGSWGCTFA